MESWPEQVGGLSLQQLWIDGLGLLGITAIDRSRKKKRATTLGVRI